MLGYKDQKDTALAFGAFKLNEETLGGGVVNSCNQELLALVCGR